MTQAIDEVIGLKSEVLTKGGAIQRVQHREELKERERLRKGVEDKRAAEAHARRIKAREERDLKIAERALAQKQSEEERARKSDEQAATKLAKEGEAEKTKVLRAQKAGPKSQAASLLDDLSKASKSSASLMQISEGIEGDEEAEEAEEFEALEAEPIFVPIKGEVYIPTIMATPESEPLPQAYDLGELLPAPAATTVELLPHPAMKAETAEELINRTLNPNPADSNSDMNIKSRRGCERVQKIINEKRNLERQVQDLKYTVTALQDVIQKFELEEKVASEGVALVEVKKNPSERVSEAKLQMLKFLNTRTDEIDHIDKAICFNKYMSDPFYMQVFAQNNQPEQWQAMIESIYGAIERPEPNFANIKPIATHGKQPIRSRTSTLGTPLASSENPVDRIAQHLGNMGI